jgi:hypothetical protein
VFVALHRDAGVGGSRNSGSDVGHVWAFASSWLLN